MKPITTIIFAGIISVICAYTTVHYSQGISKATTGKTQSVYDRVIHTGTLRCGYTPYSIGLIKDPNTGKLSGIYFDIIQELAKNLMLKVEWTEEVGWGTQIEGLNQKRYDMICSPSALNSGRGREADFSIPLYYSPVHIWAKSNDQRFSDKRDAINKSDVRISTLDGEQTSVFARNYFPLAKTISLPQTSPFSDLMLQVTTGKADITFAEPLAVFEFMAHNQNTLRQVSVKPLVIVPNIILIKRDEYAFKQMIDNALRELFNTGFIDQAITRYETRPNNYIRETTLR